MFSPEPTQINSQDASLVANLLNIKIEDIPTGASFIAKWIKKDKKSLGFETAVGRIFTEHKKNLQPESPKGDVRTDARISKENLDHSIVVLDSFLAVLNSKRRPSQEEILMGQEVAELKERLHHTRDAYIQVREKRLQIQKNVKDVADDFFINFIKENQYIDHLRGESAEDLRHRLIANASLRDLAEIQKKLIGLLQDGKSWARLLEPVDQQGVVHEYSELASALPPQIQAERSGTRLTALYLQSEIKEIINRLEEQLSKGMSKESHRIAETYGTAIAQGVKEHATLPQMESVDSLPYSVLGPDREEALVANTVQKVPTKEAGEICSALTFGAADLKAQNGEHNGDALLVSRLSNGGYLTAVADAAGHKLESFQSSHQGLEKLHHTIERGLRTPDECSIPELFQNALLEFHETTLRSGSPCTLAFNLIFPDPEGSIFLTEGGSLSTGYLCYGACIGDARSLFVTPDLSTVRDLNPSPIGKSFRTSGGSLGEPWKPSQDGDRQFHFWSGVYPPGTLIISGSDGFGDHLEADTLGMTPQMASREMGGSGEGVENNWAKEPTLQKSYTEHLVGMLLKQTADDEGEINAEQVSEVLMGHCLEKSAALREAILAGSMGEKLPGKIDDISIVVLKLPTSPIG